VSLWTTLTTSLFSGCSAPAALESPKNEPESGIHRWALLAHIASMPTPLFKEEDRSPACVKLIVRAVQAGRSAVAREAFDLYLEKAHPYAKPNNRVTTG